MAVANGIRGAVALWLAILTATGQISLWALFVGTLVFGLGETLFDNATNAVIPGVVKRRAARSRERPHAGGAGHDRQLHRDADRRRPLRGRARSPAVGRRGGLHRSDRTGHPASAVRRPSAARPHLDTRSRRARHRGPALRPRSPSRRRSRRSDGAPPAKRSPICGTTTTCGRWSLFTSLVGSAFSFAQAGRSSTSSTSRTSRRRRSASSRRGSASGALVGALVAPRSSTGSAGDG